MVGTTWGGYEIFQESFPAVNLCGNLVYLSIGANRLLQNSGSKQSAFNTSQFLWNGNLGAADPGDSHSQSLESLQLGHRQSCRRLKA